MKLGHQKYIYLCSVYNEQVLGKLSYQIVLITNGCKPGVWCLLKFHATSSDLKLMSVTCDPDSGVTVAQGDVIDGWTAAEV